MGRIFLKIRMVLNKIRTPELFLFCMILSSTIYFFNEFIWLILNIGFVGLFFSKRSAIFFIIIFIFSTLILSKTTFVLNMKNDSINDVKAYTGKGVFTIPKGELDIGVLIFGDFLGKKVSYNGFPSKQYKLEKIKKVIEIPLISNILRKRIKYSAELFYYSGGKITTAPAHLFAVREYIPTDLKDMYITTGLAHLLAMSGFHVGIFVLGLSVMLFFIPLKLRLIVISFLTLFLIPLSGFAITVIRAAIFSVSYSLAFVFDLKIEGKRFLALLAGLILLFSPTSLFSISFLLSFFAVYGILFLSSKYSWLISIVTVGVASSIFTMPLQLYFFGTANLISVFTTALLTPFVWIQMVFAGSYIFFSSWVIPPLNYIEIFLSYLMEYLQKISWYFLYVSKPHGLVLFMSFLVSLFVINSRFKYLSLLVLFLPLFPVHQKDVIIFPKLPGSAKGYILKTKKTTEIYYQGNYYSFTKHMVPNAARLGIKNFEYGSIRVFNGKNLYLKVKNVSSFTDIVCINNDKCDGKIAYYTRSNLLKADINPEKTYITYKNKEELPNILLTSKQGYVLTLD